MLSAYINSRAVRFRCTTWTLTHKKMLFDFYIYRAEPNQKNSLVAELTITDSYGSFLKMLKIHQLKRVKMKIFANVLKHDGSLAVFMC